MIVVEDGGTVEEEASEVGGGEGDVAEGGYSCERVLHPNVNHFIATVLFEYRVSFYVKYF